MAKDYNAHIQEVVTRASAMQKALVDPFRTDDGSFLIPQNRQEAEKRNQILESAIKDSIFEMAEKSAPMIAGVCARALQGYEMQYKRQPSMELLASAHNAIENVLRMSNGTAKAPGVFEGAEMSTTDGIIMRDRLVSLVLPVYLTMITSNMVTFIPGDFNQSEFFRIKRQAGSSFGDLKKGQLIDYNYQGVYSQMAQRVALGPGDGSTKSWTFDSNTTFSAVYPLKPKRTRVWVDRKLVASEDGSGNIVGARTVNGTAYTVTGTVNYAEGKVTVNFSNAPAQDVEIMLGFDVDIEKDPTLIPRMDHVMDSRVLYPHESAISGNATIQAIWALRRELGQDLDSLTMQSLRNVLAADKDKTHLRDMYAFCPEEGVEWVRTKAEGISLREHYETVQRALLEVDSKLIKANGVAGLTGIVAGTEACNLLRYLPAPYLDVAPGFRSTAQPHYVGRLYGSYDLYCDPYAPDTWGCLCYAKGPDHGQTAYVAGDAVPALTFRHSIMGDLVQRATMWELAYHDMQPFDGEDYLCKLTFVEG